MKSLALLLALSAAGSALAGITGTGHDLSGRGFSGDDADQICIYCHTPHNATASLPLWNRANSTATYTMYSSYTDDFTQPTAIGGSSVLCLSCHDGTIALNSVHNGDIFGANQYVVGGLLGTDLSNDHPISFLYQSSIDNGDTGLFPASDAGVAALLEGGKVQCRSCHDVHDNTNSPFLVMANTGSVLCLTCHNK